MACLSRSSYTKRKALNRLHLVYKRSISLTNLASGVQNWRFVYKYAVFNLQTSISPYKLASRITTQQNITMGNPDVSEEEMIRVAKTCHIHSFVMKLPKGYDTLVSDNGEDFSQGQKQLLCIARVMMCHPSMLILDEATSSIDTRTELKIQDAFGRMMEGHTSFIVAHRLSTIRTADVILVMKDGHIIEQGNHRQLMEAKGFYYDLYQSQFLGQAI